MSRDLSEKIKKVLDREPGVVTIDDDGKIVTGSAQWREAPARPGPLRAPRPVPPVKAYQLPSKSKTKRTDPLGERKEQAATQAKQHGHDLGHWHKRKGDVYGRENAFCLSCFRLAVVAVERPPDLALVYGEALTEPCGQKRKR